MNALHRSAAMMIVCIMVLLMPTPARAADDSRQLFLDAHSHYEAKRYSEALVLFERSYAAASSPNTGLLIGRCLRELGRRRAALQAFERTEEEARKRVAAGESKYGQAGEAAAKEAKALRSTLATIKVHVKNAREATLLIDGQPIDIDGAGNATTYHDGGAASIVLRTPEGEQKQNITVPRGATIETEFNSPQAPVKPPTVTSTEPPPPPPVEKSETRLPLPIVIAGGALTLIGAGVYIGFNASARGTFDELAARCGPSSCGSPADRALADEGRDQQMIATTGLVIGAIAAVATLAIVAVVASRK